MISHMNFKSKIKYLLTAMLLFVFGGLSCDSHSGLQSPSGTSPSLPAETKESRLETKVEESSGGIPAPAFEFTSVTDTSGIDFTYFGGPSENKSMTEQNGGGVALFDLDGDGKLDVYLVNGSHFQNEAQSNGASHRLYRQTEKWVFEEVTYPSGVEGYGFGMGVASGDYDNDGFVDFVQTGYREIHLWHNNGDGTFGEVLLPIREKLWGTSCAFADLDGDGDLDLYVCNYVDWPSEEPPCYAVGDIPIKISCSPSHYAAQADSLFQNLGQGDFVEVGAEAGVGDPHLGSGLAVTIVDLDQDGLLDIYVANDQMLNYLFTNQGGLKFVEEGVMKGVAFSEGGELGAGMGIGCADYNHDGRFDLCVSNFRNQANDLFQNLGASGFITANKKVGIDRYSSSVLGFATIFQDFDLDGDPDLFVANGHIWDLTATGREYPYRMHPHLLLNGEANRFSLCQAGEYFHQKRLGRSAAFGDIDNDRDVDLIVTHLDDRVELLRNDVGPKDSVQFKLIGTRSARQPLGATVAIRILEEWYVSHVPSGGSFQASHDDRVVFATDGVSVLDEVRVEWPGNQAETWQEVPTREVISLIEGRSEFVLSE